MTWTQRTIIVAASEADLARTLTAQIPPGDSGNGMFTTGLSSTGAAPASHFISHGLIRQEFADILGNASITHQAATSKGVLFNGAAITLQQVETMYAACTIVGPTREKTATVDGVPQTVTVQTDPHEVLKDMGLQFVRVVL